MDDAPERFSLSTPLLDAIMQNLAGQPYGAVAGLIEEIKRDAIPMGGPERDADTLPPNAVKAAS